MRTRNPRGWRRTFISPRQKSAIQGVLVGAGMILLLVATPLWFLGGSRSESSLAAPLAALATLPSEAAPFDISALLVGDWVGEVCPDGGTPIGVHLSFDGISDDTVLYSLSFDGGEQPVAVVGNGACDVDGEEVSFHAFLALLGECDEACGVDRLYEGHFDNGALVGSYSDEIVDPDCRSCRGHGTWWIEPEL